MKKLFDDKDRSLFRYSKHQEKTYTFYDNTAMPEFVQIREMLNHWFSRYPDDHKHSLKRDFQTQFDSAYFELFIHELFLKQGFDLLPHPVVPNSSKNPDFLAKKGEIEIYLEAKVATDKSNEERTLENKLNTIYDELNELKSPDYWIDIRKISFNSKNQAKLSKLKFTIQKWLDDSHVNGKAMYNDLDDHDREVYTYTDGDISISLSLFPSEIEKDHPIASYLGGSYSGGCEEALSNAIKEKSTRYGHLNKPYIICINLPGIRHPYPDDIYKTLFGHCSISQVDNKFELTRPVFEMNGILRNSTEPAYGQVSAFFITRVFESNLHIADHWLIKHPSSKIEIDLKHLALNSLYINDDKLNFIEGKSVAEILRID